MPRYQPAYASVLRINWRKHPHMHVAGTTGMGKTYFVHGVVEHLYEKGVKIIKLGDKYLESFGFLKPTAEITPEMKKLNVKPKTYPIEFYTPLTQSLPPKLPDIFKFYTVSLKKVIKDRLFLRLIAENTLSEPTMIALQHSVDELSDTDSFPILPWQLSQLTSSQQDVELDSKMGVRIPFAIKLSQSVGAASRAVLGFKDAGLIASHNFGLNISKQIKKIISDQKTITVFTCKYLEQDDPSGNLEIALHQYILSLLLKDQTDVPTLIVVDDAYKYFGSRTTTVSQKIMSKYSANQIREVRKSRKYMVLLSQSLTDIYAPIRSQCSTKVIFRLDTSKADLRENLLSFASFDEVCYDMIPLLPQGRFYVGGLEDARNPRRGFTMTLRRSSHVEPGEIQDIVRSFTQVETQDYINALIKDWEGTSAQVRTMRDERLGEEAMNTDVTDMSKADIAKLSEQADVELEYFRSSRVSRLFTFKVLLLLANSGTWVSCATIGKRLKLPEGVVERWLKTHVSTAYYDQRKSPKNKVVSVKLTDEGKKFIGYFYDKVDESEEFVRKGKRGRPRKA